MFSGFQLPTLLLCQQASGISEGIPEETPSLLLSLASSLSDPLCPSQGCKSALIWSQSTFRPSFSCSSAFRQDLLSSLLSFTSLRISFSRLPASLGVFFLLITSPNLSLPSPWIMLPKRFSLVTVLPQSVFSRMVCSSWLKLSQMAFWMDFGHLTLACLDGLSLVCLAGLLLLDVSA